MKRLGVFLLLLDGMLVHLRSLPHNLLGFPQQFAGTHLYSWVERGTVRVMYLAQEHDTMSRQGLEPGPLDPGTSAPTMRPPLLLSALYFTLNWLINHLTDLLSYF